MKTFAEFKDAQDTDIIKKCLESGHLSKSQIEKIFADLERRFSTSWLSVYYTERREFDGEDKIILHIKGACIGSGLFMTEFWVTLGRLNQFV